MANIQIPCARAPMVISQGDRWFSTRLLGWVSPTAEGVSGAYHRVTMRSAVSWRTGVSHTYPSTIAVIVLCLMKPVFVRLQGNIELPHQLQNFPCPEITFGGCALYRHHFARIFQCGPVVIPSKLLLSCSTVIQDAEFKGSCRCVGECLRQTVRYPAQINDCWHIPPKIEKMLLDNLLSGSRSGRWLVAPSLEHRM